MNFKKHYSRFIALWRIKLKDYTPIQGESVEELYEIVRGFDLPKGRHYITLTDHEYLFTDTASEYSIPVDVSDNVKLGNVEILRNRTDLLV